MSEQSLRPLQIAFPCLHPALCPGLPQDTLFLDPGLAPPPLRARMLLPDTMPMNRMMARACLAEMLAFGERFSKPGEMKYFSVAGMENFYDGTAMDIRQELASLGGDEPTAEDMTEKRLAAQRMLLLAWHLEEKRAEVLEASEILRSLNLRFHNAVVDDESPADEPAVDDPELARLVDQLTPRELDLDPVSDPAGGAEALDWKRLAEAVLLLLPQEAELRICEAEVAQTLGVGATPVELPGWKLAGLDAADAARPWLDRVVRCHAPTVTQGAQHAQNGQGAQA